MWKPCVLVLVLAPPSTALAQTPAAPLFQSDEIIELTLEANFDELRGDRTQESEYRPAIMTLAGNDGTPLSIEMKVKTRGLFRLKECRFPPLRINLPKNSLEGTVFDGQDKIELVSHCRDRDSEEQHVLEEYLVYRTYNLLTDESFRVRLAHVTYVDSRGEDDPVVRYAFFIEPEDAVAERLGSAILEINQLHPKHFGAEQAVRMTLFQYMIGNTDFSMVYFHNSVLMRDAAGVHFPVPYDFDWSGFVSPSYARPDEALGIRSVKDRIYRGFCRPTFDFSSVYEQFLDVRPSLQEVYSGVVGLEEDRLRDALEYVDEFYDDISSDRGRERIERTCRKL